MKYINTFIKWFKATIDTIKTVGLLLILGLFLLSLVQRGCDRRHAQHLFEKVTGLNLENDILRKDVKERDVEIMNLENEIKAYQQAIETKEAQLGELKSDYTRLKIENGKLAANLLKIPADSSYKFLNEKAYNYPGEKRFPFNEPQVKGMHLTYLENFSLREMNTNLGSQVENYAGQLALMEDKYQARTQQFSLARSNEQSYQQVIENKDEEISLKDRELRRHKRSSWFWKATTAVGAAVAVVFAL